MWFRILLFAFLGFVFGGSFGAVIGALLAAWISSQRPRIVYGAGQSGERRRQTQTAFFRATFLVMGKLAKADGRVNEEEIQVATTLMNEMRLSPDQRQQAIDLFNQGKTPGCDIRGVLLEFRRAAGSGSLVQMFMELQLQAAYADGQLSPAEMQVLHEACEYLGVNRFTFEILHQRFQAQRAFYSRYNGSGGYQQQGNYGYRQPVDNRSKLKEAYATLGVSPDASDKDVKRAYRKLMSEHHPDKLVAKGLPEEMMEMAKKKTQEIQAAYDLIQEERKRK
ncbi:co-chaperone DjlA [Kistimonas asteriae]|uniref:co-chaperone DjlA n=1 Tax=Kistimonas asteriae TaxID=517724 RepID=UPI001BABE55D|nr:co-chaperone DjlA [Kistimonas asteriae]